MKEVVLSPLARHTLDYYFENVQGFRRTDMQQRAYHYRKIINTMANIDTIFEDAVTINGNNLIEIDNICVVEFSIKNDIVLIKEIYFNHNIHQWQEYNY